MAGSSALRFSHATRLDTYKQSFPSHSPRLSRGLMRQHSPHPQGSPLARLDRARRNGTPLPMCGARLLPTQTWKPGRAWMLELPTGPETGQPRHSSPASSLEHTAHTSHPVVIFHDCFIKRSNNSSANNLSRGPHSAKWLQTPLPKDDEHQASDPLKRLCFTTNFLRCVCLVCQKASIFKVGQYSMNPL